MAFNPDDEATIKSWAYTEALRAAELVYKEHNKETTMADEKLQNIQSEPEEETGSSHGWAANFKGITDMWQANFKHVFDAYLDLSLTGARHAQSHFDKVVSDAQSHDNALRNVALQAAQSAISTADMVAKNAVTTIDMTGKQAVKHADIAADNLWSPVQIGAGDALTARAVTIDDTSLKAIGAALAAAVAEALSKKA